MSVEIADLSLKNPVMLASATAVQIGTANFLNPNAMIEITNEIRDYISQHEINSASELVGQVDLS